MLFDIRILHFEITQCLQVHDNSIPLIAGKPTVVRIIPRVDEGGPLHGVDAQLSAMRYGAHLPESPIPSSNGPIVAGMDGTRKDPSSSLDFILEPSWCEGEVDLVAELVLPTTASDGSQATYMNDLVSTAHSVKFHVGRSLDIRYVIIDFDGKTPGPRVNETRTCGFLRSIMPMDPLELTYEAALTSTLNFSEKIAGRIDDAKLIVELNKLFLKDGYAQKLYGWTKDGADVFPYHGRSDPIYADGKAKVAFGTDDGDDSKPDTWRWRRTLAHEIGHNMDVTGLHHPSNFPESSGFYPHRLQDDEFGYDVMRVDPFDRVVMRSMHNTDHGDLYDFMVAGRLESEAWVGRENYTYLFSSGASQAEAPAGAQPGGAPPPPTPAPRFYIVHGVIRRTGGGELIPPNFIHPLYVNPKIVEAAASTPRNSDYAEVRFFDSTGAEIGGQRIGWTPSFVDAEGHPVDAWFSWVTELANVRRIALYYAGVEIGNTIDLPPPAVNDQLGFELGPTAIFNAAMQTLDVSWTTADFASGRPHFEISFQFESNGPWFLRDYGEQDVNPFLRQLEIEDIPFKVLITLQRNVTESADDVVTPEIPSEVQKLRGRILCPAARPSGPLTFRAGEHLLLIGYGVKFGKRDPSLKISWLLKDRFSNAQTAIGGGEKRVYRNLTQGAYTVCLLVQNVEAASVDINVTPN